MPRAICVFCGSSHGTRGEYGDAAEAFGRLLAAKGIALVFGGGHVGLMGRVADGCLAAGGRVTGVIPQSMVERELAHEGLTELRVVASMHERKAMMADLSDGFVALPGGIGTLEETFEAWTWAQLGYHQKPVGILNVEGYFDPLIDFVRSMSDSGFMRPQHIAMLHVAGTGEALLDAFAAYDPAVTPKWVGRGET